MTENVAHIRSSGAPDARIAVSENAVTDGGNAPENSAATDGRITPDSGTATDVTTDNGTAPNNDIAPEGHKKRGIRALFTRIGGGRKGSRIGGHIGERGGAKKISIRWQLFALLTLFTAAIILILWLCQIVFLDRIYKTVKTVTIDPTANIAARLF